MMNVSFLTFPMGDGTSDRKGGQLALVPQVRGTTDTMTTECATQFYVTIVCITYFHANGE